MKRRHEPKPGQIGKYWLEKKPGRNGPNDSYCRTWYDPIKRRLHHESLRTSDPEEASRTLAEWVAQNERPEKGRPEHVLMDTVLLAYWNDHAKNLPSASTQKRSLAKWQKFWAGKTVGDITVARQKEFRAFLGEGRVARSSIDRELSVGRAALNLAVEQEELIRAPKIILIETQEEKDSRPEKGRPLSVSEMARLFAAATDTRIFMLMMLLANTLARPGALYDLQRKQFDAAHNLLQLNPEGRKQNKKHRPVVPVTATLRPWLEAISDPDAYYLRKISGGGRLSSLDRLWDELRKAAGLPDATAYSFRHGMSRELRKRRVPLEEIKLFLGHKPTGSDRTTEIYAPFDPEYCTNAKSAIDQIMGEIAELAKLKHLTSPAKFLADLEKRRPLRNGRGLTAAQQVRLHQALRSGMSLKELYGEFGLSSTSIAKYRKRFGFPDARRRKRG